MHRSRGSSGFSKHFRHNDNPSKPPSSIRHHSGSQPGATRFRQTRQVRRNWERWLQHTSQTLAVGIAILCLALSLSLHLFTLPLHLFTLIQDIAGVDIHIRRTIMLSTTPCLPPYISVYTLPPSRQLSLRQCALLSPSLPQQARCLPSLSRSLSFSTEHVCTYVRSCMHVRTEMNKYKTSQG